MTAAEVQANKRTATAEVCVVRAGEMFAGVPIPHIAEIVGVVRLQPLPHAPWFVGGLVLYRGEVLTAVDLRRLFKKEPGGPESPRQPCSMLVIESTACPFGLLVDRVDEVLTVSSDDYEPNYSILDDRWRELFDGAYKLEGRLLVMLSPERLDPFYLGHGYLVAGRQTDAGESVPARLAEGEQ
jgi:purine-binding chemotaxis protein CheW